MKRKKRTSQTRQETLQEKYGYLIKPIAKSFARITISLQFEDFFQEGSVGLIKASEHYDGKRPFEPYARSYIRGFMLRALHNQEWIIRIPESALERQKRYEAAKEKLGEKPSIEEITTEIKSRKELVQIAERRAESPLSTNAQLDLSLFPAEEKNPLTALSIEEILTALRKDLKPKEAIVLKMFFGINCPSLTIQQIADKLGLTRQGVNYRKTKAIQKLKKALEA